MPKCAFVRAGSGGLPSAVWAPPFPRELLIYPALCAQEVKEEGAKPKKRRAEAANGDDPVRPKKARAAPAEDRPRRAAAAGPRVCLEAFKHGIRACPFCAG